MEAVVEEVYLKIAEGAKRVRQEGCDRKSKKRRRAKKFGVGGVSDGKGGQEVEARSVL